MHKELRETKLSPKAVAGVFVGWDRVVSGGVKVAVLKDAYMLQADPIERVATATTVRIQNGVFPLVKWANITHAKMDPAIVKAVEERMKREELVEGPGNSAAPAAAPAAAGGEVACPSAGADGQGPGKRARSAGSGS